MIVQMVEVRIIANDREVKAVSESVWYDCGTTNKVGRVISSGEVVYSEDLSNKIFRFGFRLSENHEQLIKEWRKKVSNDFVVEGCSLDGEAFRDIVRFRVKPAYVVNSEGSMVQISGDVQ